MPQLYIQNHYFILCLNFLLNCNGLLYCVLFFLLYFLSLVMLARVLRLYIETTKNPDWASGNDYHAAVGCDHCGVSFSCPAILYLLSACGWCVLCDCG